jgi:hypothetical protein
MLKIHNLLTVLILAGLSAFVACGSDDDDKKDAGTPAAPTLGDQIDRSGRAAISTALISPFEGDADKKTAAKNSYNQAAMADWGDFKENIAANLAILDGVDTNCVDNGLTNPDGSTEAGAYDAFAGALADDQLYIDSTKKTCTQYLAQELNVLLDAGIEQCGGRTPTMDVVETSYSGLVAGAVTGTDDTITADDKTHSVTDFPFLAAP